MKKLRHPAPRRRDVRRDQRRDEQHQQPDDIAAMVARLDASDKNQAGTDISDV